MTHRRWSDALLGLRLLLILIGRRRHKLLFFFMLLGFSRIEDVRSMLLNRSWASNVASWQRTLRDMVLVNCTSMDILLDRWLPNWLGVLLYRSVLSQIRRDHSSCFIVAKVSFECRVILSGWPRSHLIAALVLWPIKWLVTLASICLVLLLLLLLIEMINRRVLGSHLLVLIRVDTESSLLTKVRLIQTLVRVCLLLLLLSCLNKKGHVNLYLFDLIGNRRSSSLLVSE